MPVMHDMKFSQRLNPAQLFAFLAFHGLTVYLLTQIPWGEGAWLIGLVLAWVMHQVRFFGISVVLHRYFSHRAFRTSRIFQFVLALVGSLTLIRGPIRFAAAHRYHHRHSDTERDLHSPRYGFLWSYVGWLMSDAFVTVAAQEAKDLRRFPELVWLDRFYWLPALLVFGLLYTVGGLHALVWGGLVSTLSAWHLAFFVTSVFHRVGHQNFDTGDDSRNHLGLALITMGEGWHNNHHQDMHSAQFSAKPSQPDPGFYGIWCLEKLGLIYDVKRFHEESECATPSTVSR